MPAATSNNYSLTGGKSDTKTVGASGVYVFCKGVKLTGNSSLTLGPGTFIIDGGDFDITSGSADRDRRHDDHPDNETLRQAVRHLQDHQRPDQYNCSDLGQPGRGRDLQGPRLRQS